MHLERLIQQLGFSKTEARVYLATLSLGEASVTDISRKSKLPRTSLQYVLEKLHEKGLVNFYAKRQRRVWIAEDPKQLLNRLKELESAFSQVLPVLIASRGRRNVQTSFKYYEGKKEVREILDGILRDHKPIMSFTSEEDAEELLGRNFRYFITDRIRNKLKIRFITNKTPLTLSMKIRDVEELRKTRFLATGAKIHNANFIYGDKTAILSLDREYPNGVVITDPEIAHTQKILFEALWEQSAE